MNRLKACLLKPESLTGNVSSNKDTHLTKDHFKL